MQDEGWLLLVGLVVVVILVRQSLKQHPVEQRKSEDAGGTKAPPVLEPTHVRGEPIGEAQRDVSPRSGSDHTSKTPKPQLPKTAVPNAVQDTKKPPLTEQDRMASQKRYREQQEVKKSSEDTARRAVAQQLRAEKEAREKIEKAKGMAAAEARKAEEEAKKSANVLRASSDKERDQQRRDYLRMKIPARIQHDMDRFLAGEFEGPEQSPLTYVGYHVGVVRGLSPRDRIERLEVCFRVQMPTELYAEYRGWGEPATTQRLNAMIAHIGRHAAIRSTQPKYDRAVAEWEADRAWLLSALGPKADAFSERWLG